LVSAGFAKISANIEIDSMKIKNKIRSNLGFQTKPDKIPAQDLIRKLILSPAKTEIIRDRNAKTAVKFANLPLKLTANATAHMNAGRLTFAK
jgi:hypothetical protein